MSCPLYIRSVYSLLSSMCSIENIVSYGQKLGYKALGLVDRNVLSGAMSFKKACEAQGIKPVYGLELDVKANQREYTVVLYAKDDIGFSRLMALSSYICTHEYEVIDVAKLNEYKDHNVLCLLSDNMPLTMAIDKNENIQETLKLQNELFGEYIVGLMDHDIAINVSRDNKLRPLLKQNHIPCMALNRTFYLDKDDSEDYSVLKCIRDKVTIDDTDLIEESGRYLLSKDELDGLYENDELAYTDLLASETNVKLDYKTSLPKFQNKNNVDSKDYLISLCKEGLRRRLKNNVSDEYSKRLDYELSIILKMHFEDYFLIVYDFILFAKKNNILVGPARGSAGGSLVSYCLGITDIDPLKYGLIFERFLNPERISMPDIDTDFPDDRRDEVIEYVKNKYGLDHVAHIITFGTLKAKQVIRDVGRALNYSTREIDSISKLIPNFVNITLDKAYETAPLFKQKIESDSRYRKLYSIAKKFEFFPRHESTHAAGIVFSSKPISEVVPVTKIESDLYSSQYTAEYLEELGLIKMDFLGLRNLGIIAEVLEDIKSNGETVNIKDIPLDDKKTFDLIDRVDVLGVFQLESNGMRNLIRKMKPKTFEEIGMTIALFRPGPMENIPMFLENRANPSKVRYIHPNLKPILQETYGIIVYQEQVMNIARVMAGFSYGKADILRKAMSKKKMAELEKLKPDFINGCIRNGYDASTSNEVYELVLKFANYGFNKSHSIGYGMVAYQMAYLKANFPLYFYKALLNGVIGAESKTYDYLSECLNANIKVKGISLNDSDLYYMILDENIVMPFTVCKDVGFSSANKIMEERYTNGPFVDYVSSVRRLVNVGVDKLAITNLIYAGGFDEFGYSRYTMISSLDNVLMYAQAHKGEVSLLDEDDAPLIQKFKDDKLLLAENEKNVLGFYFSVNPIVEIKNKYHIECTNLYDLSNSEGYGKGFGLINRVKTLRTKKGDMMAFADVSDDKGSLSLAVMPNVYSMFSNLLEKGKYVYFEGKVDRQGSILVKSMKFY